MAKIFKKREKIAKNVKTHRFWSKMYSLSFRLSPHLCPSVASLWLPSCRGRWLSPQPPPSVVRPSCPPAVPPRDEHMDRQLPRSAAMPPAAPATVCLDPVVSQLPARAFSFERVGIRLRKAASTKAKVKEDRGNNERRPKP